MVSPARKQNCVQRKKIVSVAKLIGAKKKEEEYEINDALRKMIVRQKIKQYPTEKRLRLKKRSCS